MGSYNRQTDVWCNHCNNPKPISNFYVSLNPLRGYLPYCKNCLNKKFKEYQAILGSDGAALYCLCAEVGYPLISSAWEVTKKVVFESPNKNTSVFSVYHNTLKETGLEVQGIWQSDLELSDFIQIGENKQFEDKPKKAKDNDLNEQSKIWGHYEVEDYELLNQYFDMYTKDMINMDVALELRYRDLCKAELMKRKADEEGDIAKISQAQKALKSQLDLLKLSDFKNNQKTEIEQHIERLIWKIENTKPAECEDLNKYKDFSGFEKPFADIKRCLQNLVGGTREYPEVPKDER